MNAVGLIGGALLLLAAPEALPPPPAPVGIGEPHFAPPLEQPMTYRVTTRRVGRGGTLVSFSLVYALEWQKAGRGYRLDTVLRRIESDARPELVKGLTGLLDPLVGQTVTYLVGRDGRRIDLADPEQLWARVAQRTQNLGAAARAPEARQMARLLAGLPTAERDRFVSADIRAIIAPANAAIPGAAGEGISIREEGAVRTVTMAEQDVLAGETPLRIDMTWSVDTATGLVLREQRTSWTGGPAAAERTLADERIRVLAVGDPG